jgi:predicted O-linked N-acetylglucosamine transferase (SPINDLY family)
LGDYAKATDNYRIAIQKLPNLVEAYHNLGQAHAMQNNLPEAINAYEKALQLDPQDFKSAYNLSLAYRMIGREKEAIGAIQTAIRAHPDSAEAFCILGMMYHEQDRFDEAHISLEQALCIQPDCSEARYHRGIVFQKSGQFEHALDQYEQAMLSDPELAPAKWLYHLSLPMIYDSAEDIEIHRIAFKARLDALVDSTPLTNDRQKAFALSGIQTTTNFFLQYQSRNDLEIQKTYGQFVHKIMAANFPQWSEKKQMPSPMPEGKIRIGYISSFMYHHTVGTFLSGWLESHTASDFDITCYHVGKKTDDLTHQLQRQCRRFHYFGGNMEAAAHQIFSDNLHILIYTDIGMDPITTQLAALKLAPVQCKGWGHPVTTGLPTIDYYLSSDLMEPPGAGTYYSETLIRLPNLALCYRPPVMPEPPKTRGELGLPDDRFIYLSTQSIFKYLPQHDDIYPRIAKEVPEACFVFLRNQSEFATERFHRRLQAAFADFELEADRYCHFSDRLNFNDFISLNRSADVLLDSLEWSGGKTTLEALSCELPVVTLPGRFMRGRHAYAMLRMIDVTETIASDKTSYCDIAVKLAKDPEFFATIKTQIAENRGKLYHDRMFMRVLERFYREVVAKYPDPADRIDLY